eukprot:14468239-Alexandrium_andersonii.AAC.1
MSASLVGSEMCIRDSLGLPAAPPARGSSIPRILDDEPFPADDVFWGTEQDVDDADAALAQDDSDYSNVYAAVLGAREALRQARVARGLLPRGRHRDGAEEGRPKDGEGKGAKGRGRGRGATRGAGCGRAASPDAPPPPGRSPPGPRGRARVAELDPAKPMPKRTIYFRFGQPGHSCAESEPGRARVNVAAAAYASAFALVDGAVQLPEPARASSDEPAASDDAANAAAASRLRPTTFAPRELDDCLQALSKDAPGWGILDSGCATSLAAVDAADKLYGGVAEQLLADPRAEYHHRSSVLPRRPGRRLRGRRAGEVAGGQGVEFYVADSPGNPTPILLGVDSPSNIRGGAVASSPTAAPPFSTTPKAWRLPQTAEGLFKFPLAGQDLGEPAYRYEPC